jgi:hypothetical protein
MTNDEEAYNFYLETELSDLAYQIIQLNQHHSPQFLTNADSTGLIELLKKYIEVPNPFVNNAGDEQESDDDYLDGD